MEQMSRPEAVAIWRNGRVPVIYKPEDRGRLIVRVPFADSPRKFEEAMSFSSARIGWVEQFRAWTMPRGRFAEIVRYALARHGSVYLIQAFRRLQKCAPMCWRAKGPDCECSCMGANHGSGHALEYEVSETFAFEWGERQLACRLLKRRSMAAGVSLPSGEL